MICFENGSTIKAVHILSIFCIQPLVIAIAIESQAVDRFGIEICGIVGGDETVPFGGVVAGVAVVEAGVVIVVVAPVADGVSIGDGAILTLVKVYHWESGDGKPSPLCSRIRIQYRPLWHKCVN